MRCVELMKAMIGDGGMVWLGRGVLDVQATKESLAIKARKREARQKSKKAEQ